jgi:hypothetical protein
LSDDGQVNLLILNYSISRFLARLARCGYIIVSIPETGVIIWYLMNIIGLDDNDPIFKRFKDPSRKYLMICALLRADIYSWARVSRWKEPTYGDSVL